MKKEQASMSISLPKRLKEYIRERSKQGMYGTPSDYVRDLVRQDYKQYEQEKLEMILMDGLESGEPIIMNDAEQKKLEKEVFRRVQDKKNRRKHA